MKILDSSRVLTRRRWFRAAGAVVSALGCVGVAGPASASPYNPENLDAGQLARVAELCRSTLGLRASEPAGPAWGAAVNPGLTSGENHYQGCIASLSHSLRDISVGNRQVQIDAVCLGKGFKPDTADFAECALDTADSRAGEEAGLTAASTESSVADRPFPGSFFAASNREVRHREQLACARLGLDPGTGAFDGCVKGLADTFFSIENPQS